VFEPSQELRALCDMLEAMLAYHRNQPAADNAAAALENLCLEIQERVNLIQELTAQIRYPFDHETEHVMIGDFLRNKDYHANPCELALREGKSHVEKIFNIYHRLLGTVVVICANAENHLVRSASSGSSEWD
jgi:hypothetical protein